MCENVLRIVNKLQYIAVWIITADGELSIRPHINLIIAYIHNTGIQLFVIYEVYSQVVSDKAALLTIIG